MLQALSYYIIGAIAEEAVDLLRVERKRRFSCFFSPPRAPLCPWWVCKCCRGLGARLPHGSQVAAASPFGYGRRSEQI